MKKALSLILVLATVLTTFVFVVPVNAAPLPSPAILGGYENICLTYTYRPERYDYGRQTSSDLLPYVGYLDVNGKMKDFFFDTYLFLPCNTTAPSGANIHGGTNSYTIASDWEDYVNDTFYEGKNVDALEIAFGHAKSMLNDYSKKAGVIFSILYPNFNMTSFGTLGGKNLNFSKQVDREYAIKWIIDEQIKRFTEGGYQNLDLLGFYWLEEQIYSQYDKDMMNYASEYLHSLGLKFIWIPYYQASGYQNWESYGFDLACMQPNDMWSTTSDPARVTNCASLCNTYGMSMQIEASHDCAGLEHYTRYLRYLDGGLKSGAMDAVKFYYQDGKEAVYYAACYSDDAMFRSVYDLTYKYAKGTLSNLDYDLNGAPPFEVPDDVDWVSYGKTYTGCESFVDGNGMPYQQVSGTELTDGVLGSSIDGTEWHAYHISILDEDGRMSSTIDLGKVYTDLTHVMAEFLDYYPYNIGLPKNIKIHISEDGETFRLLSGVMLKSSGDDNYIKYVSDEPFTARYVKLSFTNTNTNFVFCSEFLVGRYNAEDAPDVPTNDTPVVSPDKPELKPVLTNVAYGKSYDTKGYSTTIGWPADYTARLTDGLAAQELFFDNSWFAFCTSEGDNGINAPNGIGTVTIDLEESYELTKIRINALKGHNIEGSGINSPIRISAYVSDSEYGPFTYLGNLTSDVLEGVSWVELDVETEGRYVKIEVVLDGAFAFINEIEVYGYDYVSKGDINGNGEIDSMDYLYLKRAFFKQYNLQSTAVGDINGNGEIDSMDYLYLKRAFFKQYVLK